MYDRPVLDVDDALNLVDAALAAAPGITAKPLAITILDDRGDWVASVVMDGAPLFIREHANRKALTAALMRMDLQELAAARNLVGRPVSDLGDPRLTGSSRGGVAIKDPAGNVIGALGVSGGAPEEDERVAREALAAAPLVAAGGAA